MISIVVRPVYIPTSILDWPAPFPPHSSSSVAKDNTLGFAEDCDEVFFIGMATALDTIAIVTLRNLPLHEHGSSPHLFRHYVSSVMFSFWYTSSFSFLRGIFFFLDANTSKSFQLLPLPLRSFPSDLSNLKQDSIFDVFGHQRDVNQDHFNAGCGGIRLWSQRLGGGGRRIARFKISHS